MKDTKLRYKSKTLLALLPILLFYITKISWVELPESEVMTLLESWTTFALTAYAIYGRFTADKKIK